MWQIEFAVYVTAFVLAVVNAMLFCMWWDYQKVMLLPHVRNLARFYTGMTILLIAVLLANTYFLCRSGSYTQWEFSFWLIAGQALLARGIIWRLKKNYNLYLIEGKEYRFIISSVSDQCIGGYMVVGKYWIYAEDVAPYAPEDFSELKTVKAVFLKTDAKGKAIVRV